MVTQITSFEIKSADFPKALIEFQQYEQNASIGELICSSKEQALKAITDPSLDNQIVSSDGFSYFVFLLFASNNKVLQTKRIPTYLLKIAESDFSDASLIDRYVLESRKADSADSQIKDSNQEHYNKLSDQFINEIILGDALDGYYSLFQVAMNSQNFTKELFEIEMRNNGFYLAEFMKMIHFWRELALVTQNLLYGNTEFTKSKIHAWDNLTKIVLVYEEIFS